MEKLCAVVSCLVLMVGASSAQTDSVKPIERPLAQWLTGVIAVVGFLFLTFVFFLAKRAWCHEPDRRNTEEEGTAVAMTEEHLYETSLDLGRSKKEENSFYNEVFDSSGEKVTAM